MPRGVRSSIATPRAPLEGGGARRRHVAQVAEGGERRLEDDAAAEPVEAAVLGVAGGVDRDREVVQARAGVVERASSRSREHRGLGAALRVGAALRRLPRRAGGHDRGREPEHGDERRERAARRAESPDLIWRVIGPGAPGWSPDRQASRSSAAAVSGATTQRCTPVPSSSPARCVSRGTMSIRQQKCSAPRGAVRTQRLSGGIAPSRRRRRGERVVHEVRAERAVVLEARARAARGDHQLERQPRGVGRDQHRLVVDRHDALAPAHLLLHEVAEQVAAHRARGVGAEALALARDGRRDEVQRVELGMGVRQRRAAEVPLVDEHVHAGRAGVRAHARAPGLHRHGDLLRRDVGQRGHRVGRVDDHLVRAGRRLRAEQVGLGLGRQRRRPRARAPGRGSAPRARSSPACRVRRRRAGPRRARAACGPRGRAGTGRARGRSAARGRGRSRRPGGPCGRRR